MRYYPVQLDVKNRKCLVVGGGEVGSRKAITLLECGAMVTIVSPYATEGLEKLAMAGSISLKRRSYRSSDMEGMFMVIGATDDESLNRKIYEDAAAMNILCNIADRPEACNFILPAIVARGDLVITISTSGRSPAFARRLRKELENQFGHEYAEFLQLMGELRKKLLSAEHAPEEHKQRFERLITGGLLESIRSRDKDRINSLLGEVLGAGFDFDELMGRK